MRFIVSLLTGILLISCRTTRDEDERFFAKGKRSNNAVAGVKVTQKPQPTPGTPVPSPLPDPAEPLENGAFYRLCVAKNQVTSEQALTIQSMLAATHQSDCEDAERWLRDTRNASLMMDSEELVEWQSLTLLQNYPHIRNVYITVAKGLNAKCPLALPQICHFRVRDF